MVIQELTKSAAEKLLQEILGRKEIYLPLQDHPELLKTADLISQQICELEDHIQYLDMAEKLRHASDVRYGRAEA